MPDVKDLAFFFGTPIGMAAVFAYAIKRLFQIYRSDMKEDKNALRGLIEKNSQSNTKMSERLQENSKAINANTEVSKQVKTLLMRINGQG